MSRYPVTGPASIVSCPVHHYTVALDAEGRISSRCPECRREALRGTARFNARVSRRLRLAPAAGV